MKQKMKNSIKKVTKLIALFSLIILSSCEKENDEITNQKNANVIAFKNVSLKDLVTSKTNAKLLESVNNIKNLKSNSPSKVEYNSLYDFYIDQDNGKYIETAYSKTYTFPIYRLSEDNNVENIVFTENPDGSYDVLTTKYDVTKEELEANPNGTESPVDYTIISSKLDAGGGSYIYVDMLMCDNDGFGGTGNPHSAGSNCTDSGHLYTITVIIYVPGSGGAGSGTPIGTGTGSSGNNTTTSGGATGGTTTSPVGGSYTTAQLNFIKTINDLTEARASFMNSDSGAITAVLNYITTATPAQVIAVRSFLNNANTFWLSLQSPQTQTSIYNYLIQNNFSTQSVAFVNQFISNSVANPDLQIDFNLSIKSPAFIDMSSVNGNTPEEIKFREVYNNLTESPLFKQLFINMFGTTPLFNVKFAITDIPQSGGNGHTDGRCRLISYPNNPAPFNLIEIDRSHLLTNPKVNITLSILHECIHAYLNIKLRNPSIGMSISNINNLDFQACINTYYNNFSGNQTQHSFFVDNMIPTMVNIFTDIKDQLLTPTEINAVENPISNAFIYAVTPTIPSTKIYSQVLPWNWDNFFTHLSYNGLQECSEYPSIYPIGSPNSINHDQYIYISIFTFLP